MNLLESEALAIQVFKAQDRRWRTKLHNCSKCGGELSLNERLSSSMSSALGIGQLKVFFCARCTDNLYVEFQGSLYSSEEWKRKREQMRHGQTKF